VFAKKGELLMIQNEIEFSAKQIALIDSGEAEIFLENVNTNNQIYAKIFCEDEKMTGVYFCCTAYGGLRASISFESENDAFNEQIVKLMQSTLTIAKMNSCSIWIRNSNKKSIELLKERFNGFCKPARQL
jgi:hypothetical protein